METSARITHPLHTDDVFASWLIPFLCTYASLAKLEFTLCELALQVDSYCSMRATAPHLKEFSDFTDVPPLLYNPVSCSARRCPEGTHLIIPQTHDDLYQGFLTYRRPALRLSFCNTFCKKRRNGKGTALDLPPHIQ